MRGETPAKPANDVSQSEPCFLRPQSFAGDNVVATNMRKRFSNRLYFPLAL